MRQFRDDKMVTPRDTFSMTPQEIDATTAMLTDMTKDLMASNPQLVKKDVNAQNTGTNAPQQGHNGAGQSTPLNAANLQQLQKQTPMQRPRSNRGSQAPAAPTTSQPPFQFGAASPHGTPLAYGKAEVTQDQLFLPPRKRQKGASGTASTPGGGQITPGSTASPQMVKASPSHVKAAQVEPVNVEVKPALVCSEPDCDRHTISFHDENELQRHIQEDHIKPIQDPLKFLQENATKAFGMDADRKNKLATKTPAPVDPSAATHKNVASKQAPTSVTKASPKPPAGASTPMNQQLSAAGAKSGLTSSQLVRGSPAQAGKDAAPTSEPSKVAAAAVEPAELEDPWTNSTIKPGDLSDTFAFLESGANGAIADMNVYRSITGNDTPESSKDGASEPNSDISENLDLTINLDVMFDNSDWQPFGLGDAYVNPLMDLSKIDVRDGDDPLSMFDDMIVVREEEAAKPMPMLWDMADRSYLDAPLEWDQSLFQFPALDE